MNTTPENITPKKPRALPRRWQRFIHLEIGDDFFIGRCRYVKCGFFGATTSPIMARRITVPPWRRVQTDVLLRDALPRCGPPVDWVNPPQGPGHPDNPVFCVDMALEGSAICERRTATEIARSEDMARVPQPHSDNNITGPTS